MGVTKDAYLRGLDQQSVAEELAVEWGVLKRCYLRPEFTQQVDWDLGAYLPHGGVEIQAGGDSRLIHRPT